jgi:hypothetical protein
MASIEKHISDLLSLHDCVIVPELGGFVANYKAAVAVDERNLFLPPAKEIGFNRSLSHNDGLLTNQIIKREQKTWQESTGLIRKFVKELQYRIDNGESAEIQGIGSFRKDALGNLQFTPIERNHLLPDAFGLDEFHFEPLHATITQKQEEPVRRLLRSRSPKYWTSVAAMIAGLLLFSPHLEMPDHQQMDTSNMISAVAEGNSDESIHASAPKTEETVEDLQTQKSEAKTADNKEDTSITPKNIESPYHLIAASFKYEAPASETLDSYKSNGFSEAQLLHSDNGRYRVALFSFEERTKAVEKLYALRKEEAFKNVWLLTN